MSATTRTLILVKPDAFERGLTGEVLARFERKGLTLTALKLVSAEEATAHEHYAEHTERPFFGELVAFITGGPLVAAVFEGVEAVKAARQLIGATNPIEAETGSIRGDFGTEVTFNLVHGSDSDESAEREIGIWFPELGLEHPGPVQQLILASASPRRRELLSLLGLEFEVVATGIEELTEGEPAVLVVENALRKARAAARPDAVALGVDTDVVLDGRLLGKPERRRSGPGADPGPRRPDPCGAERPRTRRRRAGR